MFRRLFCVLMIIFSLLLIQVCHAEISSGVYYELEWTLNDDGVLTLTGTGEMNGFAPDSEEAWRPYEMDIKSVTISNGITSVGRFAFEGCSFLTSVSNPETVTSIGMAAFNECINLEEIDLPNSITTIGYSAFEKCKALKEITLPNNLKTIEGRAFSFCESLVHIQIPSSVSKIQSGAFTACKSLASITIPDGITEIESNTFFICYKLSSITLPKSVKKIQDFAFYECRSVKVFYAGSQADKEKIVFGTDYPGIKDDNWYYNVNPDAIIRLPSGTVIIEENALVNTSASIYIIPEGVETIKSGSFSNLSNAVKTYIPSYVTQVEDGAFSGSENA